MEHLSIEELQVQCSQQLDMIKELKEMIRQRESVLLTKDDEAETKLREVYAQMVFKDHRIMELGDEVVTGEKRIMDLLESISERDEVIRSKDQAIQLLREDHANRLADQKAELEARLARSQTHSAESLAERESELDALRDTVRRQREELVLKENDLMQLLKRQEDRVAEVFQQHQQLQQQAQGGEAVISFSHHQEQLADLHQVLTSHMEAAKMLQAELSQRDSQAAQKEVANRQLRDRYAELEQRLAATEADMKTSRTTGSHDLDVARKELAAEKKRYLTSKAKGTAMEKQVNKLKKELAELQKKKQTESPAADVGAIDPDARHLSALMSARAVMMEQLELVGRESWARPGQQLPVATETAMTTTSATAPVSEISELEAELSEARDKLSTSTATLVHLQEELAIKDTVIEKLNTLVAELRQTEERLRGGLEEQTAREQEGLTSREERIACLEIELTNGMEAREKQRLETECLTGMLKSVEGELEDYKRKDRELQVYLTKLESHCQEQVTALVDAQKFGADKTEEIAELREVWSTAEKTHEAEILSLNANVSSLQQDLEQRNNDLAINKQHLDESAQAIASLKAQTIELREQIEQYDSQLAKLSETLAQTVGERDSLAEVKRTAMEHSELLTQRDEVMKTLQETLKTSESNAEVWRVDLDELNRLLLQKGSELEDMKKKMEMAEQEVVVQRQKFVDSDELLTQRDELVKSLQEIIRSNEEDLVNLRKQLEMFRNSETDVTDRYRLETETLNQNLSEKTAEIDRLVKKLESTELEISASSYKLVEQDELLTQRNDLVLRLQDLLRTSEADSDRRRLELEELNGLLLQKGSELEEISKKLEFSECESRTQSQKCAEIKELLSQRDEFAKSLQEMIRSNEEELCNLKSRLERLNEDKLALEGSKTSDDEIIRLHLDEIASLTLSLTEKSAQIQSSESAIALLRDRSAELEDLLNQRDELVKSLQEMIRATEANILGRSSELEELNGLLLRKGSELEEMTKRLEFTEGENKVQSQKCVELGEFAKSLQEIIRVNEEELGVLKMAKSVEEEAINQCRIEIESLKVSLSQKSSELERALGSVESLELEVVMMRQASIEQVESLKQQDELVKNLQEMLRTAEANVNGCRLEVDELNVSLLKKGNELEEMAKQLERTEDENQMQSEQCDEFSELLLKRDESIRSLQQAIQIKEEELGNSRAQLESSKNLETTLIEVDTLHASLSQKSAELESISKSLESSELEIATLRDAAVEHGEVLNRRDESVQSLQAMLKVAEANADGRRVELEELNCLLLRKQTDLEEMAKKLDLAEGEMKIHSQKCDELNEFCKSLQETLRSNEDELKTMRTQLETESETEKSSKLETLKTIESLQSELEEVRKKFELAERASRLHSQKCSELDELLMQRDELTKGLQQIIRDNEQELATMKLTRCSEEETIIAYRTQIEKLNASVSEKSAQHEVCLKQLSADESEIMSLRDDILRLQAKHDHLYEEKLSTETALNVEKESVQQCSIQLELASSQAAVDVEKHQARINELQSDLSEKADILDRNNELISSLRDVIRKINDESENERLRSKQVAQELCNDLAKILHDLDKSPEVSYDVEDLETTKVMLNDISSAVKGLMDSRNDLQLQLLHQDEQWNSTVQHYKETVHQLTEAKDHFRLRCEALETANAEMSQAASEKEIALNLLSSRETELQRLSLALEQKSVDSEPNGGKFDKTTPDSDLLQSLSEQIAQLKSEKQSQVEEYEQDLVEKQDVWRSGMQELKNEIRRLLSEGAIINDTLQRSEATINAQLEELVTLKAEKQRLIVECERLQTSSLPSEPQIQVQIPVTSASDDHVEVWKSKFTKLVKRAKIFQETVKAQEKKIDELNSELSEANQKLESVTRDYRLACEGSEQKDSVAAHLQNTIETQSAQICSLKQQASEMESEIEQQQSLVHQLQDMIRQQIAQLDERVSTQNELTAQCSSYAVMLEQMQADLTRTAGELSVFKGRQTVEFHCQTVVDSTPVFTQTEGESSPSDDTLNKVKVKYAKLLRKCKTLESKDRDQTERISTFISRMNVPVTADRDVFSAFETLVSEHAAKLAEMDKLLADRESMVKSMLELETLNKTHLNAANEGEAAIAELNRINSDYVTTISEVCRLLSVNFNPKEDCKTCIEAAIRDLQHQSEKAQADSLHITNSMETVMAQLEEACDKEVERLSTTNDLLTNELRLLREQSVSREGEVRELRADLLTTREQLETAEHEVNRLKTESSNIAGDLSHSLLRERDDLIARLNVMKDQVGNLTDHNDALKATVAEQEEVITDNMTNFDKMQRKTSDLERQRQLLLEKLDAKDVEFATLTQQLSDRDASVDRLTALVASYERSIAATDASSPLIEFLDNTEESDNCRLRGQLQKSEAVVNELEATIVEKENRIVFLEKEALEVNSQLEQYIEMIRNMESRLAASKKTIQSVLQASRTNAAMDEIMDQVDLMYSQFEESEKERILIEEKLARAVAYINKLKRQAKERDNQMLKLRDANRDLSKQLADRTKEVNELTDKVANSFLKLVAYEKQRSLRSDSSNQTHQTIADVSTETLDLVDEVVIGLQGKIAELVTKNLDLTEKSLKPVGMEAEVQTSDELLHTVEELTKHNMAMLQELDLARKAFEELHSENQRLHFTIATNSVQQQELPTSPAGLHFSLPTITSPPSSERSVSPGPAGADSSENQPRALRVQLNRMRLQLDQLRVERNRIHQEYVKVRRAKDEADAEIARLSREMQASRSTIDTVGVGVRGGLADQPTVTALEEQIASMQSRMIELEAENESLRIRQSILETKCKKMEIKIRAQKTKHDSLLLKLDERDSELDYTVDHIRRNLAITERERCRWLQEMSQAKAQLFARDKRIQEQEKRLRDTLPSEDLARTYLDELQHLRQELERHRSEARAAQKDRELESGRFQGQIEELVSDNRQLKRKLNTLQRESEVDLEVKVASASPCANCRKIQHIVEKHSAKIRELQGSLASREEAVSQLTQTVDRFQLEKVSLTEKLTEKDNQILQLQASVKEHGSDVGGQNHFQELQSAFSALEVQLRNNELEKENLIQKLQDVASVEPDWDQCPRCPQLRGHIETCQEENELLLQNSKESVTINEGLKEQLCHLQASTEREPDWSKCPHCPQLHGHAETLKEENERFLQNLKENFTINEGLKEQLGHLQASAEREPDWSKCPYCPQLRSRAESLQEEVGQLLLKVSDMNTSGENLQREVNHLRAISERAADWSQCPHCTESSRHAESAQTEVHHLRLSLNELAAVNKSLEQHLKDAQTVAEREPDWSQCVRCQELQQVNDLSQKTILDLQDQVAGLDELEDARRRAKEELDEAQKALAESRSQVTKYLSQIEDMTFQVAALEALKSDISSKEATIRTNESVIKTLQEQQGHLDSVQSALESKDLEIQFLKATIQDMEISAEKFERVCKADAQLLKENLSNKELELDHLKKADHDREGLIQDLQERIANESKLEVEYLQRAETSENHLSTELHKLTERFNSLQRDKALADETVESLSKEKEELHERLFELEWKLAEAMEKATIVSQTQAEQFQLERAELDHQLKTLALSNAELAQRIAELEEELASRLTEQSIPPLTGMLQDENRQLKTAIQERGGEIHRLQEERRRLLNELEECGQQVKASNMEFFSLKEQLQRTIEERVVLEEQVIQLNEQVEEMLHFNQSTRQEMRQLQQPVSVVTTGSQTSTSSDQLDHQETETAAEARTAQLEAELQEALETAHKLDLIVRQLQSQVVRLTGEKERLQRVLHSCQRGQPGSQDHTTLAIDMTGHWQQHEVTAASTCDPGSEQTAVGDEFPSIWSHDDSAGDVVQLRQLLAFREAEIADLRASIKLDTRISPNLPDCSGARGELQLPPVASRGAAASTPLGHRVSQSMFGARWDQDTTVDDVEGQVLVPLDAEPLLMSRSRTGSCLSRLRQLVRRRLLISQPRLGSLRAMCIVYLVGLHLFMIWCCII